MSRCRTFQRSCNPTCILTIQFLYKLGRVPSRLCPGQLGSGKGQPFTQDTCPSNSGNSYSTSSIYIFIDILSQPTSSSEESDSRGVPFFGTTRGSSRERTSLLGSKMPSRIKCFHCTYPKVYNP